MNSFLGEPDDSWNAFATVLATDASVPEKARPHLARWGSRWRHADGEESAAANTAFFEELGRGAVFSNPFVIFVSFMVNRIVNTKNSMPADIRT